MARKVIAACGGSVRGKTIAHAGPDLQAQHRRHARRAVPRHRHALQDAGAKVRAYDPAGHGRTRKTMLPDVAFAENAYACAEGADALVIVTEWDAFRALDLDRMRRGLKDPDPGRPAQHLPPGGDEEARLPLRQHWTRPASGPPIQDCRKLPDEQGRFGRKVLPGTWSSVRRTCLLGSTPHVIIR